VFDIFLKFQTHVERLLNRKILRVQSDWGGEYIKLNSFFDNLGILHRVSCPHTHQQNGTAEQKHRHIVETGLTLLAHASAPFPYWSDAFSTPCFLINRMPTKVIDMQSPVERPLGETPDYTFFKVFGCACWLHTRPYNSRKLEFRLVKCVFLGYSSTHKGYKCLHIPTNRIYISHDVVFDEQVFPFADAASPSSTTSTLPSSSTTPTADQFNDYAHAPLLLANHGAENSRGAHLEVLLEASASQSRDHVDRRPSSLPVHGDPCTPAQLAVAQLKPLVDLASPAPSPPSGRSVSMAPPDSPAAPPPAPVPVRPVTRAMRGVHKPKERTDGTVAWLAACIAHLTVDPTVEPQHFRAALGIPHWRTAMEQEFEALVCNQTWRLVPPVSGANIIDCKWVKDIPMVLLSATKLGWLRKASNSDMVSIMRTLSVRLLSLSLCVCFLHLQLLGVGLCAS
jgi:histone deacetylase 1/2